MIITKYIFLFVFFFSQTLWSGVAAEQNTSSVRSDVLEHFDNNPTNVKKLILMALNLADKRLGYLYGSADPKNEGMDCSGTMFYILSSYGLKDIPRSSEEFYNWVKAKGRFYAVNSVSSAEYNNLKPGDLLFWNGTYATNPGVNSSHVMLYLGKDSAGKHLMFGSSDGRTFRGKKVYGVSVFDFFLINSQSKGHFIGYSCIPKLSC